MTTDSTGRMTLEQAIASVQERNEMRGKSGEYPNGQGWGHCWREDGYWLPKEAWIAIRDHLAPRPVSDCGHGWVHKRADGVVARCGGPGLCKLCAADQDALESYAQRHTVAGGVPDVKENSDAND